MGVRRTGARGHVSSTGEAQTEPLCRLGRSSTCDRSPKSRARSSWGRVRTPRRPAPHSLPAPPRREGCIVMHQRPPGHPLGIPLAGCRRRLSGHPEVGGDFGHHSVQVLLAGGCPERRKPSVAQAAQGRAARTDTRAGPREDRLRRRSRPCRGDRGMDWPGSREPRPRGPCPSSLPCRSPALLTGRPRPGPSPRHRTPLPASGPRGLLASRLPGQPPL